MEAKLGSFLLFWPFVLFSLSAAGTTDLARSASDISRHSGRSADAAEKLAKKMGDILKKSTSGLFDAVKQKPAAAVKSEAVPAEVTATIIKTTESEEHIEAEVTSGWLD